MVRGEQPERGEGMRKEKKGKEKRTIKKERGWQDREEAVGDRGVGVE